MIHSFLSSLACDDLPAPVIQRTKMLVLDLLGTALAATETPLASIIRDYTLENYQSADNAMRARLIFDDRAASLPGAALVGGMTIDAVDAHDGHKLTKGHVGCAVLPSVLAVAEGLNKPLDGPSFLRLMIAGYEIGTRAGIALHATTPDYHTSGAWNAVTCAAISAHMLSLNEEEFNHAIGIAEYHGPRSQMMRGVDYPTMLKDGSGWGGMAGISAALMAQKGFTGAPALTVVSDDVASVWSDLGENWQVMQQYIKGYPVCRWAQPAVYGALKIRQSHSFDPTDIASVDIFTFHQASRLSQEIPIDTEQAQYAISFPVSAALARGKVGMNEISKAIFSDQEVIRIHQEISIREKDQYNNLFPAERWAEVEVSLIDGRHLKSGAVTAPGDPENQFSDKEISDKFFELTDGIASIGYREELYQAVMQLDKQDSNLSVLTDLIYQRISAREK